MALVSISRTAAAGGPEAQVSEALSRLPGGAEAGERGPRRGDIVALQQHMEYVVRHPYLSAVARGGRVKDLAVAAFSRGTYALASQHCDVSFLATDATGDDVRRLLATAVAPGTVDEWFTALQPPSVLLPQMEEALALGEDAIRRGMAEPGAPQRSPMSIAVRARTLLHIMALQRALSSSGGPAVPADVMRRTLLRHTLSFTGSGAGPPKACVMDFEAMIASAGWPRLSRATCGFPFPSRVVPQGHLPLADVNALVLEYLELVGPIPDDDAMWTVAAHLYEHDVQWVAPASGPSLDELVRRSWHPTDGSTPGPLRLGKPAVVGARHAEALEVVEGFLDSGPIRLLTEAEVADPAKCKVIIPLSVVFQGDLDTGAEERAAIAGGDAARIAAVAQARAATIAAAAVQRVLEGTASPSDAVEATLREHRGKECKKRMVFGGHLLKPYIHKASFAYSGIPAILEHHATGDEYGKADASNFFYCGAYSQRSRPYLCCSFPGLGGTGVAQFERWIMGAPDSPMCASLLSSLIVFIARMRAGDDRLVAYMDDFLWAVSAGGDSARIRDALVHTLRVGNIPENVSKRVEAGKATELLGLVFRSSADVLELPARKQFKYMVHAFTVGMLLRDARVRGAVSKDSLLSLAGRLQWWCCAAAYGRPHLGGLYAAAKMPPQSAAAADRALEDLTWWEARWLSGTLTGQILINPRKRTFIRVCGGAADRKLRVFESDAGEPGGGAVCDGKAVYVPFGPLERSRSSQWREARVILELFEVAGPSLEGAHVLVLTDNLGNVFNFMKGSCKAREVTRMIQAIYDIGERYGITWVVSWLPRECNQTADAISKCATRAEAAALCGAHGLTLEEPAPATRA